MEKNRRLPVLLFILAQTLTFLFITLLQLVEFPLFLVFLLLMHTGIILFIVSKKHFTKLEISVKKFYQVEYVLLALYLPILFYKIFSYVFLYEVNEPLKLNLTLIITALNIVISGVNTARLTRFLRAQQMKPE
jgi:amino acid transporter